MFKQDFAFRLVKLNQIETTMWGTEFIRRVNEMVREVGVVAEASKAQLEQRQLGQRESPGLVTQPTRRETVKRLPSKAEDGVGGVGRKRRISVKVSSFDAGAASTAK